MQNVAKVINAVNSDGGFTGLQSSGQLMLFSPSKFSQILFPHIDIVDTTIDSETFESALTGSCFSSTTAIFSQHLDSALK